MNIKEITKMSEILNDNALNGVSGGGANGQYWSDGSATYYRIAPRDTLSEIALKFGTNIYAIQRLNPTVIKNVDLIRVGDVIRVL
jgi:LysM repeat protein